jgi:hypothetical protein
VRRGRPFPEYRPWTIHEVSLGDDHAGLLSTTIARTSQISNVLSNLLTFQAVQLAPSTSNITLPPR